MKRNWGIRILLVGLISTALFYLYSKKQSGPEMEGTPLPKFPETVSEVGRYYLDATRYVEVRRVEDRLEYWEGKLAETDGQDGKKMVVNRSRNITEVKIQEGWRLGFEPTNTIVIVTGIREEETGEDEIVRRAYGEKVLE